VAGKCFSLVLFPFLINFGYLSQYKYFLFIHLHFQLLLKTMVKMLRLLTAVLVIAPSLFLSAQDIHFSQYLNSPMNLGPGMTGVFGGDMRFTANYRNQWRQVPVPYSTFSGVVENKFYLQKQRYDRYLTGGLILNQDRQGDLRLTSLQVGIPVAITLPLKKKVSPLSHNFLTLGVVPMFGQRSFGTNKFTFDAQYVDCMFDPSAAINESQFLERNSLTYFDFSAGLNYRWQSKVYRSKIDVGTGWHHINRPDHDFWQGDDKVKLERRLAFYTSLLFQVKSNVDIVGQGLYQTQGAYKQVAFGAGARFHLNQRPYHEFALQVGANFRQTYNDAIIPHVEAHFRTWTLGLSYDINISPAKIVTNRRGGPEVALIYRLYKVKPLSKFKSCPII
jgi:type IX secretion system PorP/SprF family membrane protein